jgi:hypothetical protein
VRSGGCGDADGEAAMKKSWILAALVLAGATAAAELAAAPRGRSYVTAVRLGESEAARFDVAPPSMLQVELDKALADATLRATLNQKHLARIGTLTLAQPAVIDVHFVGAGTHDVGLEIGADGGLVLLIHRPIAPLRLSLAPGVRGPHVPQAAFAFLAGDDPERLEVEVRFGASRGTLGLGFADGDVIAAMNNLAFELLMEAEASRPALDEALKLARAANDRTAGTHAEVLDTLALALFRTGSLDEAIETQKKAVALAPQGSKDRAELQAQLDRFEAARGG